MFRWLTHTRVLTAKYFHPLPPSRIYKYTPCSPSQTARPFHWTPPSRSRPCPSCSHPLPTPLPACTSCWYISGLPSKATFHEIFGLPYDPNPFVVDLDTLKQRFRQAQATCHPDSWASKGSDKQDVAQALSALINEAYQGLLKPLARAEYILERNNFPMSETEQLDDMGFISEIMEAREEIENADEPNTVIDISSQNNDKIRHTLKDLEELVGKKDWPSVKAAAVRLKYLEGIERAAKAWMDVDRG